MVFHFWYGAGLLLRGDGLGNGIGNALYELCCRIHRVGKNGRAQVGAGFGDGKERAEGVAGEVGDILDRRADSVEEIRKNSVVVCHGRCCLAVDESLVKYTTF